MNEPADTSPLPTPTPLKEVLVAMDFSEGARAALAFAERLLCNQQTRLHLLTVDDDPLLMQSSTSQEFRDEHEDKMAMRFVELLPAERREKYRTKMVVRCGTAFYEIVNYADENAIDLIVIGTHRRSQLSKMLLGSVADRIVHKANCPVLTVPPGYVST